VRRALIGSVRSAGGQEFASATDATARILLESFAAEAAEAAEATGPAGRAEAPGSAGRTGPAGRTEAPGRGADAVELIARPLAQLSAARITGLPIEAVAALADWAESAVSAATGIPSATGTTPADGVRPAEGTSSSAENPSADGSRRGTDAGIGERSSYATALIHRELLDRVNLHRRGVDSAPTSGALLDTIADTVWRGQLDLDGVVEVLMLVLIAALDTTTGLIGNCLDELANTGSRLSTTEIVERVLAHRPPVRFVRRVATRTHRLADVIIAEGTVVVAYLLGGGQLAFGAGPHACPGAALARTVARSAVSAANAAGTLRHTGPPVLTSSAQLDTHARLPLTVLPVSAGVPEYSDRESGG
jgi:cytochrome P450